MRWNLKKKKKSIVFNECRIISTGEICTLNYAMILRTETSLIMQNAIWRDHQQSAIYLFTETNVAQLFTLKLWPFIAIVKFSAMNLFFIAQIMVVNKWMQFSRENF